MYFSNTEKSSSFQTSGKKEYVNVYINHLTLRNITSNTALPQLIMLHSKFTMQHYNIENHRMHALKSCNENAEHCK